MTTSERRVFICYQAAEETLAERLKDDIQAKGYPMVEGQDMKATIRRAACVVVVLGKEGQPPDAMRAALDYARSLGKPLFPVQVAGDLHEPVLAGYSSAQILDMRDETAYADHLPRLLKDIGHHVLPDRLSEPKRPSPKPPAAKPLPNRNTVSPPPPIRHHVRQVPFNKRHATRIGGPYHWVIVLFGSVALVCSFLFVLSFFLPDDEEDAGGTEDVASDFKRVRYFDGAVKMDVRSEWVAGTVSSDVHTEFLLASSDSTWDEAAIADDYLEALAELPAGEAFIAVQVYGYEFGLEMQREVAAYPPSYIQGEQYVAEVSRLAGYVVDEWRYEDMVVQEAFVPFHSWAVANVMLYARREDAAALQDEFEEVLRSIAIKMGLAERPDILLDWEDWGLQEGGDLGVPEGSPI